MSMKRLHVMLIIVALLPFFLTSCYMHVEWKNWEGVNENPLVVDGVKMGLRLVPSGSGLVSGGSPYTVTLNAQGDVGIHEAVLINSLVIKLSSGEEIDVECANGVCKAFENSEIVAYPKGKYGLYITLKDKVDISYRSTDSLLVLLDVSVIKKMGILFEN